MGTAAGVTDSAVGAGGAGPTGSAAGTGGAGSLACAAGRLLRGLARWSLGPSGSSGRHLKNKTKKEEAETSLSKKEAA